MSVSEVLMKVSAVYLWLRILTEDPLFNYTHVEVSKKNSKGRSHCHTVYLCEHLAFVGDEGCPHRAQAQEVSESILRNIQRRGAIISIDPVAYHSDSFLHRNICKQVLNIQGSNGSLGCGAPDNSEELSRRLYPIS